MAKQNKYDRTHDRRLNAYLRQVDEIYREAAEEAAALGLSIDEVMPDRVFSFSDYPRTRKKLDALLNTLTTDLSAVIVNGVKSEWTLANNKNNELCRQVFGDNIGKLPQAAYQRYFSTNSKARDAFIQRKDRGLKLSDRVWNYTNQFKDEIELGLDVGIRSGLSAPKLARQLQDFLKHPDMLFRRVRDEHGQLQLSKRAAAYHPGRGVYRSSYKNARRLAATECNMAYREADYLRWQQFDFVVGILIEPSKTNHPTPDICDDLAGKYPKDFKWTGWHPHCRCHALTVLKTMDEMAADTKRILDGEEPTAGSVNEVKDLPDNFLGWMSANEERMKTSYSMPYFISDNIGKFPALTKKYGSLWGSKTPYDTSAEYQAAMRYNSQHAGFTAEQRANNRQLSNGLPIIQGRIMTFTEADDKSVNPMYGKGETYSNNCQTCTVAYELRRRGFSVRADKQTTSAVFSRLGMTWQSRWHNKDGTVAKHQFKGCATDTAEGRKAFIEAEAKDAGRYEVYCKWKKGRAHVFIVERQKNGALTWYDPQTARHGGAFDDYLTAMSSEHLSVLRIDDKLINTKMVSRFKRSK